VVGEFPIVNHSGAVRGEVGDPFRADEVDKERRETVLDGVRAEGEDPGRVAPAGILQGIREFSAGHQQADDITLICFGRVGNS